HLGGLYTHDARAEDEYPPWRNTRHPTKEHSPALDRFFQVSGSLLYGHAACYFRHGSKQGQGAVRFFDRFVSNAHRSPSDHRLGKVVARSEMEIGEDDLAGAGQPQFIVYRLFDF